MEFKDKPLQYAIYKGINGRSGCVQFNLKPFNPDSVEEQMSRKEADKARKGAVFIEAANAIGPNKYDYDNAVKISMSETDLAQFIVGISSLGEEGKDLVSIYHKIEKGTVEISKNLKIKQGKEDKDGKTTFMFSLFEVAGDNKKSITVPISLSEMFIIKQLFTSSISTILGW